jgi:[protein-PII] uridylyltransferase
MLYLLSCADLAAVGPGVLNPWKVEVLTDLYGRLMEHLSGGATPDTARQVLPQRKAVLDRVAGRSDAAWYQRQIAALPPAYLYDASIDQVVEDLDRIHGIQAGQAEAWGRYLEERGVTEYSIAAHEEIASGIFHRLTGALTSQGLQILSAEIHSLADALFLDRFRVEDPDHRGRPPEWRFQQVTDSLVQSLQTPGPVRPSFRVTWQDRKSDVATQTMPTQVKIDNSTSDQYTIIDVFAHDRTGLLFTIARTIYELGLSVRIAKIGTFLDQVVDVFYVSDRDGRKVRDEQRLSDIRSRIFQAIEQWKEQSTGSV